MKRKIKNILVVIAVIACIIYLYNFYYESLGERLFCNKYYTITNEDEIFKNDYSFKQILWEKNGFQCPHAYFEKEYVNFISDSSLIIITYTSSEEYNYFSPILYLFDLIKYESKWVHKYYYKDSTIFSYFDPSTIKIDFPKSEIKQNSSMSDDFKSYRLLSAKLEVISDDEIKIDGWKETEIDSLEYFNKIKFYH